MKYIFFLDKRDEPWWGLGKTANKFSHTEKFHMLSFYHKKQLQLLKYSPEKYHMPKNKMEKLPKKFLTQIDKGLHYRDKIYIYNIHIYIALFPWGLG